MFPCNAVDFTAFGAVLHAFGRRTLRVEPGMSVSWAQRRRSRTAQKFVIECNECDVLDGLGPLVVATRTCARHPVGRWRRRDGCIDSLRVDWRRQLANAVCACACERAMYAITGERSQENGHGSTSTGVRRRWRVRWRNHGKRHVRAARQAHLRNSYLPNEGYGSAAF